LPPGPNCGGSEKDEEERRGRKEGRKERPPYHDMLDESLIGVEHPAIVVVIIIISSSSRNSMLGREERRYRERLVSKLWQWMVPPVSPLTSRESFLLGREQCERRIARTRAV